MGSQELIFKEGKEIWINITHTESQGLELFQLETIELEDPKGGLLLIPRVKEALINVHTSGTYQTN